MTFLILMVELLIFSSCLLIKFGNRSDIDLLVILLTIS